MDQVSTFRGFGKDGKIVASSAIGLGTPAVVGEQLGDGDIQKSRHPHQRSGGNTVGAVLIFLNLLERDAQMVAQGGLRKIGPLAIKLQPSTDCFINRMRVRLWHDTTPPRNAQYTAPNAE